MRPIDRAKSFQSLLLMKVLFIDKVHPSLAEKLEEAGFTCHDGTDLSRSGLMEAIPGFGGLVLRSRLTIDQPILEKASKLRFIARAGSGMENIDTAHCREKGIACINAPEGNRDAVAEHALGMLLSLFNKLCKGDREVRNMHWDRVGNQGESLDGKNVGIIGFGHTGSAFARKLAGFDCRILAYDRYRRHFSAGPNVRESTLEELLEESDVISLHVPLTEETRAIVNEALIEKAAKPFWLINTARGACVRTEALMEGIRNGRIRGACLDVLEFERSDFSGMDEDRIPGTVRELLADHRVLYSPHVAGSSTDSPKRIARVLARKILEAFPGAT